MKLGLIGFGQAGGKIVDKFLWYDQQTNEDVVQTAVAVNTARSDLEGLEQIPPDDRVLIGQSRVQGHGVGADNELGAEIAEDDLTEISHALDQVSTGVDAFLIVAALGGGTGSGGGPVLAKHLKQIYTQPVYALGILPAADEGGIYTLNAARSLQTFTQETDNLLVFDNDAWRNTGESLDAGFDEINEEIARRFGVLFSAGEVSSGGEVGQSVVDSSEIINTLGGGGISTVGYAAEEIQPSNATDGLLSRLLGGSDPSFEAETQNVNRITSLVRKAVLGRLTLPCELNSIERALLVVSGPPDYLSRKGIERGRQWLEEETGTMEVRGGDYPITTEKKLAAVVLLSGVGNSERIQQLRQTAVEAQDNIEEIKTESDRKQEQLVSDENDELDSLF